MSVKNVIIIFLMGMSSLLMAEYGCMAKSYHLTRLNDPKEYYYVTGPDGGPCPCPCSRHCAHFKRPFNRGKCPVCGHYRVPRPLIIADVTESHVQEAPKPNNNKPTPLQKLYKSFEATAGKALTREH